MEPLKYLKCLNKDPHPSHIWAFQYDNPKTDYQCRGIEKTEED